MQFCILEGDLMLRITLVRHGETDSNRNKKYLGWTDVELNEKGIAEAEMVRDKLRDTKFDFVISSPLKRAKATAKIIRDTNIIYEDALKEINFGLWDNLSYKEIKDKYPDECEKWSSDWKSFVFPQGEGPKEMYTRVSNFMNKLKGMEGSISIVTHGGIIRSTIAYLLEMGIEGAWHFATNNCGITVIEVRDSYAVLKSLND